MDKKEQKEMMQFLNRTWRDFCERIWKADWINTKFDTLQCVQDEIIGKMREKYPLPHEETYDSKVWGEDDN